MAFSRADTSVLGRWWWTVDRLLLAALLVHRAAGASAGVTATVRRRISLSDWSDSLVELRARLLDLDADPQHPL